MPVQLSMEDDILRIVISGATGIEDFLVVAAETRRIEAELDRCPDRIVDLTGATSIGVGYEQLSSLAMQRSAERPRNRYRIMFVANSEVGYGICRIYQSVGQHADITVRRVETVADAELALAS